MSLFRKSQDQLRSTVAELEQRRATLVPQQAAAEEARVQHSIGAATGEAAAEALYAEADVKFQNVTKRIEAIDRALTSARRQLDAAQAESAAAERRRLIAELEDWKRQRLGKYKQLDQQIDDLVQTIGDVDGLSKRIVSRHAELVPRAGAGYFVDPAGRALSITGLEPSQWRYRLQERLYAAGLGDALGMKLIAFAKATPLVVVEAAAQGQYDLALAGPAVAA